MLHRSTSLAPLFCLVLLVASGGAGAKDARAQLPVAGLSEEARISLLTVLPGDRVYSLFGHSAVRVHDPLQGIDVSYNYGTFDFSDPLFLPRFVWGRLDYFLSLQSFPRAMEAYRAEGRPVIEQVLDLSAEERARLFAFLQTNARPENRYYRYDFLFDNCSTRIRDAFPRSFGPAFHFAGTPDPGLTFRGLLDPYLSDRPFLHAGIDLLLGSPTDRPAPPRATMFLPDYLMAAFEGATLEGPAGTRPLVARTDTLLWPEGYTRSEAAWPWPALLAWLLLAGVVAADVARRGRPARRRWPDALLLGTTGLAGLLMVFMGVFTEHTVTGANWNVLWAWPTHLVAAVLVARGRRSRGLRGYLVAAAIAAAATTLGWWAWPQALPAVAFPLALLLAWRCARLAGSRPPPAADPNLVDPNLA